MKIGDSVDLINADGQRKIGVIREIHSDVVTILVGGGEGHATAMVNPKRLQPVGPRRWRVDM